jgi:hypothetical protein
MKYVKLPVSKPDEDPILAGRLTGKRTFLRLLEEMPPIHEPTIVILDFRNVDLATSSFLSEAVLPIRDHLILRQPPGYVVVANLVENVAEELDELLRRSGDAILSCAASQQGKLTKAHLIGKLEPKLLETFNMISNKGEASAVELHSKSKGSNGIGPTAWNNRLAALASKSLLVEIPHGRTKKYRPVVEIA